VEFHFDGEKLIIEKSDEVSPSSHRDLVSALKRAKRQRHEKGRLRRAARTANRWIGFLLLTIDQRSNHLSVRGARSLFACESDNSIVASSSEYCIAKGAVLRRCHFRHPRHPETLGQYPPIAPPPYCLVGAFFRDAFAKTVAGRRWTARSVGDVGYCTVKGLDDRVGGACAQAIAVLSRGLPGRRGFVGGPIAFRQGFLAGA
jgi:hypothetical protein